LGIKIGVLIACHNRRNLTLRCLRSLDAQAEVDIEYEVFLVDDGSSDGTAEAVMEEFPSITVISGDGHLYWSGGMRLAFQAASNEQLDFHLWLNDDVVLDRNAVSHLLSTYEQAQRHAAVPSIVVGAVQDPVTGVTTYSGWNRGPFWRPFRFEQVEPGPHLKSCDTMNGNVVLIPRDTFQEIGAVDSAFVHTMGDLDYGLRLSKQDGQVWLAPSHVGTCKQNDLVEVRRTSLGRVDRVRDLASLKMMPPRPWLAFSRRHGGPLWPVFWLGPYAKAFVTPVLRRSPR
jgi:GT2 family glycosyltransferase